MTNAKQGVQPKAASPTRGELRLINGVQCRFVEHDDRGEVWEIISNIATDTNKAADPKVQQRIRSAIYRLLEQHGAEMELLAVAGSWGDTLPDDEIAGLFEAYLQDGKVIHAQQ